MKKLYTLFLLAFASSLGAQNWSPVTLNDTFHFRRDGDDFLTVTYRVNSFTNNGSDTTFQFNTIGCDSCLAYANGPGLCNTCYGLLNQPQAISGYSIVKLQNGSCTFTGAQTQVLETQAAVGASWLFDAGQGLTAQVVSQVQGMVLGQSDSIKTALISNGDSLVWSKNHGLVQWPGGSGAYYRLAGIQGRNLGDRLQGMKDYFNFDVGDMFEYEAEYYETYFEFSYFKQKLTITGKQITGDTLFYDYQGALMTESHTPWAPPNNQVSYSYTQVSGTLVYIDSLRHAGHSHHRQMLSSNAGFTPMPNTYAYYSAPLFTDELWYETRLFTDSLQLPGLEFGGFDPVDSTLNSVTYARGNKRIAPASDTTYMVSDGNSWSSPFIFTACRMKKGLGVTACSFGTQGFMDGFQYSEALIAYRKGNDTVGVFTPDDIMLGLRETTGQLHAQLFPNPADAQTTISVPGQNDFLVRLLNLQGQVVESLRAHNGRLELPTENLASGLYIVEISTSKNKARQKLLVQH